MTTRLNNHDQVRTCITSQSIIVSAQLLLVRHPLSAIHHPFSCSCHAITHSHLNLTCTTLQHNQQLLAHTLSSLCPSLPIPASQCGLSFSAGRAYRLVHNPRPQVL